MTSSKSYFSHAHTNISHIFLTGTDNKRPASPLSTPPSELNRALSIIGSEVFSSLRSHTSKRGSLAPKSQNHRRPTHLPFLPRSSTNTMAPMHCRRPCALLLPAVLLLLQAAALAHADHHDAALELVLHDISDAPALLADARRRGALRAGADSNTTAAEPVSLGVTRQPFGASANRLLRSFSSGASFGVAPKFEGPFEINQSRNHVEQLCCISL